jgi:hypothetical protein
VVSFKEWGKKQIYSIISQATSICSSCRVVKYSTKDYSELIYVYFKKDTSCVTGKWWPNSIIMKKCVSFRTVSIILSIPCTHVLDFSVMSAVLSVWLKGLISLIKRSRVRQKHYCGVHTIQNSKHPQSTEDPTAETSPTPEFSYSNRSSEPAQYTIVFFLICTHQHCDPKMAKHGRNM